MNAQDREDLRDLNRKFDKFLDVWNKKKTDDAGFHATMKLKVKDIDDHEKRGMGINKANAMTTKDKQKIKYLVRIISNSNDSVEVAVAGRALVQKSREIRKERAKRKRTKR